MEKKSLVFLTVSLFLSGFYGSFAQAAPSDEICLTIPRNVVVKMVEAALPMTIETQDFIKGEIWIHAIDHLTIGSGQVAFQMNLRGRDIKLETQMGNQVLMMDLGQLDTTFDCAAKLRFDRGARQLYITPRLAPVTPKADAQTRALDLVPLLGLVNGIEFPVDMQKLQPFVTEASKERLGIDLEITQIHTETDKVVVTGRPRVEKRAPVK